MISRGLFSIFNQAKDRCAIEINSIRERGRSKELYSIRNHWKLLHDQEYRFRVLLYSSSVPWNDTKDVAYAILYDEIIAYFYEFNRCSPFKEMC